jgi:hypothetical protein
VALLVVPEEAELSAKFGAAYQDYRRRTGGLFPRFIFDTPGDDGAAAGPARGEA